MDNINDMQIGKAGEYLVCADLITKGYIAYPSEQGLPYDVVLDAGSKLLKVQVKTTRASKAVPQRKEPVPCYQFNVGLNGKGNKRSEYGINDVDMFAVVSLDNKIIGYLPSDDVRTTMNFRVPSFRGGYHDEKAQRIKSEVIKLKNNGLSCPEIAKKLDMKLSYVYKYSADVSIEQKGTNAGTYIDELTLEKCLDRLG